MASFQQLGLEFEVGEIEKVRTREAQLKMGVPGAWASAFKFLCLLMLSPVVRAEAHLAGHAYHTYRLTSPDGLVSFEFQARARVPASPPPRQLTHILSWRLRAAQRVREVHLRARHGGCSGVHCSTCAGAFRQNPVQHGGRAVGGHGMSCNVQSFARAPPRKLVRNALESARALFFQYDARNEDYLSAHITLFARSTRRYRARHSPWPH